MAGFNFLLLKFLVKIQKDETTTQVQSFRYVHPNNYGPRDTLETCIYSHRGRYNDLHSSHAYHNSKAETI